MSPIQILLGDEAMPLQDTCLWATSRLKLIGVGRGVAALLMFVYSNEAFISGTSNFDNIKGPYYSLLARRKLQNFAIE
jgi:hypothetical protein